MDVVTESSHARIVVRQGNDPLRPVVGSQSEGVSSGGRADLDYPHNSRQSLGISSSGSQLETGVPSERSMRHYSGVSENSVTSSSPFGDDFEESSVVRGGEDIGLAGHDSLRGGWLAHASTECLTGNGTGNLAHQGNQSYAKTLEDASNSFSMAASPGSGRNSKFSQPSGDADEAEARQIKQVSLFAHIASSTPLSSEIYSTYSRYAPLLNLAESREVGSCRAPTAQGGEIFKDRILNRCRGCASSNISQEIVCLRPQGYCWTVAP